MKMARATKADLDAAMEICNLLKGLGEGCMPSDNDEICEDFDSDDVEQCKAALSALLRAANKGNLFRVVFGMMVVLDPENELLDQNASTLEKHPNIKNSEDMVALLKELLDIEGPQPGTSVWADKVFAVLEKVETTK